MLDLTFWQTNFDFIEMRACSKLATETAVRLLFISGAFQHFFFVFTDGGQLTIHVFDIHVARGAHGLTTAFADNPVDAVEDGSTHDALIFFGLNDALR